MAATHNTGGVTEKLGRHHLPRVTGQRVSQPTVLNCPDASSKVVAGAKDHASVEVKVNAHHRRVTANQCGLALRLRRISTYTRI